MRPQIVKIVSTLFVTIFVTTYSWSQRVPPPPQRSDDPPPFPELPIDNNILILFVFGLLLGVFFLLRKKRSKLTT